jgi:TPR repeat protein
VQNDPVVELAQSYYTGTAVAATAQDEFNAYLAAAQKGDAKAMFMTGVCYGTGKGCRENAQEAFAWYAKAASKGVAAAQYNLGVMHMNGTGVPKSPQMAQKWLNEAVNNGYAEALPILGVLYYSMETPEYHKAFECFSKAANEGNAMALYYLGECYWNGRGTAEDIYAAIEAYRKSGEKGYQPAQEKLMEIDF